MVEAYAWADVLLYQELQEAKAIRDKAWKYIPDTDKFQAQNLARKYRLNYTRVAYLDVRVSCAC